MIAKLLWVALGGAIGSALRYATTLATVALLGGAAAPRFPLATYLVNVPGCFLIGLIHHFAMATTRVPPDVRLFLTTGVLGGLTTYSSFNYETLELARAGAWTLAAMNLVGTVTGGLLAGLAGMWVATFLARG